ncbi:uncharacterized protein LOC134254931 [Saccostrea cucullata]|uniref:uncharacterized protein LOC134254931 n=1 Tax=Saccostrea cuccullata TaxID=36930 RepID=UPI002ED4F7C4
MNWRILTLARGMSDNGGSNVEESDEADDFLDYDAVLRCHICHHLFRKPRILPCGHTFCEECLIQLRDKTAREWRMKFPLNNKRGDGGTLHCQIPGCQYSMKLMNLTRWAPRNRVASEAIKVLKRNSFAQMGPTKRISENSLDMLDCHSNHYGKTRRNLCITTGEGGNAEIVSKVAYTNHRYNKFAIAMQLRHTTLNGAPPPGYTDNVDGKSFCTNAIYDAIIQSGFGSAKMIHVPPKAVQGWRSFAVVFGIQAIGECFSFQ